jgi:integrase
VLDELSHLNIEFVSLRENIDTGGPLGRAMVVIVGAIAELEKSLIVERVKVGMRRARLEGGRIGRTPLNVDRPAIVRDRLAGLSLTEVAKKHRVPRATVCRLVNESRRLKKTGVAKIVNQEKVIPLAEGSNSEAAAKDPETGEPVHRLKWNREYLGLPKIVKDEQHVPALTVAQVDKLVSESKGDEQALYVIAAGGGLRIAEILGVEVRHIVNNGRTLVVEQSVNRFGRISGLKTRAAKRNIDVSKVVGDYLLSFIEGKSGLLFKTKRGTPYRAGNLRRRWLDKRLDDYGFHTSADSVSRIWKRCEHMDI